MNVYRITNKHGSENVSGAMIDSLERLDMVIFQGTRIAHPNVLVYEYVGRCKQ